MPASHLLGLTYTEFCQNFKHQFGRGAYHAGALYRQIFQQGQLNPLVLPEYQASPDLAATVVSRWSLVPDPIVTDVREADLIKFVTRLHDGFTIESVIVPMSHYATLCISSQVGCRMGCVFCRTGAQRWQRNLTAAEIVAQVMTARQRYAAAVRNIVFMGMGEPLDNCEQVFQAVRVMADPRGLNIPHSRITLSTVGLPRGLARLAHLNWRRLKLAISLNAVDQPLRCRLMPIARTVSLADLQAALINYSLKKAEVFLIGYILFDGLNDTPAHARQLAAWVAPLPVRVNLIAFNPEQGIPLRPAAADRVELFRRELVSCGVFVRQRTARGQTVAAACGQLGGCALKMHHNQS